MVNPGDANRLFLQAFLSRRVVSLKVLKKLHQKTNDIVREVDPKVPLEDSFEVFYENIRSMISRLDAGLEIQIMTDEITGEPVHALINLRDDEISQLATEYAPVEISFFKQLVERIIQAPNESYSISSFVSHQELKNLPNGGKITSSRAETLMESFVIRGWFLRSVPRNRFSLGPRSVMELSKYIMENFEEDEDWKKCFACKVFVFKGHRCPGSNGKCSVKIHKGCFTKRTSREEASQCPDCSQSWSNVTRMKPVGEEAIEDGVDEGSHRRNKNPRARGGDSDDDEQESIDIEPPKKKNTKNAHGKGRKSASQATRKSSRKKRADSEEEEEEEEATGDVMESDEDEPAPDDSMDVDDGAESTPPPPPSPKLRRNRK